MHRDTASRVLYTKILEAEDTRVYSQSLADMLVRPHAGVRRRAATAIGRIGDPAGVEPLLGRLKGDATHDPEAKAEIVFALGEIESPMAVPRLLELVADEKSPLLVRARAIEALGKIGGNERSAAGLGKARLGEIASAVESALPPADREVSGDELLLGSLGVTALLRLKQPSATRPLTALLGARTSNLRWQAANALARLRPDANPAPPEAVTRLLGMLRASEPLERAHAARALGAAKSSAAFDGLVRLLKDPDIRVQANAVRALAALGDVRAAEPLNAFGERLLAGYGQYKKEGLPGLPPDQNLLLVVVEALGSLKDPSSLPLLARARALDGAAGAQPETELAIAAFGESAFFDVPKSASVTGEWHHVANYAQGLGAVGGDRAKKELLDILAGRRFGSVDARAVPDVITALGKLKPEGLEQILIDQLSAKDFVVRATAASLVAEMYAPSQSELSFKALDAALKASASDTDVDARLAILDALSKYKRPRTLDLLSGALQDPSYVVRRRAAELLEAADAGTFLKQTLPAVKGRRPGFYDHLEALMRQPNPIAVISTEKGDVRLELLAHEAPMTVDNFVELSRKNYFDGTVFHRVVPNFVVQGGDPRGDGNGGPGYQIRCEINEVAYDRGVVGMALSGKDTGGSQFFFTHAPQPHLDGGYTVFARVLDGMDVVDRLVRGDKILGVRIIGTE